MSSAEEKIVQVFDEPTNVSLRRFYKISTTLDDSKNRTQTVEAMSIGSGVLVKTFTEQRDLGGNLAFSEALAFVPNMRVIGDETSGYRIVSH